MAAAQFEAVINLALLDAEYSLADEPGLVRALGMTFFHIPVIWESPTPENLQQFFKLMRQIEGRRAQSISSLRREHACECFSRALPHASTRLDLYGRDGSSDRRVGTRRGVVSLHTPNIRLRPPVLISRVFRTYLLSSAAVPPTALSRTARVIGTT